MKATVGRWTALQSKLPQTSAGDALWHMIERRTFGKRGQTTVAIALSSTEAAMVKTAERGLDDEYGRYVEMAG